MTTRGRRFFASDNAAQPTGLVNQLAAGMPLQSSRRLLFGLANDVLLGLTIYSQYTHEVSNIQSVIPPALGG